MSQHYELLISIIACSKLEQAIILLRNSQLFSLYNSKIIEVIEGDSKFNVENDAIRYIDSKYYQLQFASKSNENLEGIVTLFTAILQVLDDKKDASSETLQKKRSKQELDIFTIFAHEFRTPLTVIQSSVELLLDFFPEWDTEKITTFLQSIQQQSTSISSLLEMIAELYDARSNTQEVVDVTHDTIEAFFEQIQSILSKRFQFTLSVESEKNDNIVVRIPIRALIYVMSVALQSFQSNTLTTSILVSTQNTGLNILIETNHKTFSNTELKLLSTLFTENIIEDVSGEWLPYLMASICSQYLNATITISNTSLKNSSFNLYLQNNNYH